MSHETEHPHSNQIYYGIWLTLLVLTIIEVGLAYRRMGVAIMLILLMGISLVKAGMIISYFMHLRYEKPTLALTLIPMLIITVALLASFFPDSFRVLELRPR